MVREVTVEWTVSKGAGGTTVLFFNEEALTINDQLSAVGAWLAALRPLITSTTGFRVAQEGRELDTQTGALSGSWGSTTVRADVGTASGTAVSNASMLLTRWNTPTVLGGRFIRGRSFIPGVSAARLDGGEWNAATVTAATTAAQGLLAAGAGFGVWKRPVAGFGGFHEIATATSVWNEVAVLRRRR